MLRTSLTTLAALVFVTAQAASLAPEDFTVRTMADLVKLCGVSERDPLHDAAKGFCLGYLDGAHDYHDALTQGKDYNPIACPGKGVTRERVVKVVLKWAKNNRKMTENEAAIQGVMRAVSQEWPCPGK